MALEIEFLDKNYKVEEFNDTHILPCLKLLTEGLDDIQAQSRAGMAIKEIIIPTIPDEIIEINGNGLYIIRLDAEELNNLLMRILTCHYEFTLNRAKQKGKAQGFLDELQERLENAKEALKLASAYTTLKHTIHLVADPEKEGSEDSEPNQERQDKNAAEIKALQDRLKSLQS
jgi:uncharacterized membrane protein